MTKKIEKLKEINESVAKRCAELETYMFIENISDVTIPKSKDIKSEQLIEPK